MAARERFFALVSHERVVAGGLAFNKVQRGYVHVPLVFVRTVDIIHLI